MKEYVKCLYYENACFDNPIVTVRDGQDRKHLTLEEVVELLNTLHQENQDLKFQLDECANNKLYSRRKLEEENEQLKNKLNKGL